MIDPQLRLPFLAAATWFGALAGLVLPLGWLPWLGLVAVAVPLLVTRAWRFVVTALALMVVAGGALAGWHRHQVATGPLRELSLERALVRIDLVVTDDPRIRSGRFGDEAVFGARVLALQRRGGSGPATGRVLVFADPAVRPPYGTRLRAWATLLPAQGELSALVRIRGDPERLGGPGPVLRTVAGARACIRDAVAGRPEPQDSLVPALVIGDDAELPELLTEQFRETGLTHLLAVSGTNLTLMVGFLVLVGRWLGVRSWGHLVVGLVGIVGFVLLARPEPSVVRAAAMGAAALPVLGGRRAGARALGLAVLVVLLADPWWALNAGFALSVLATAGIIFFSPGWTRGLSRWLPGWLAEAVAVPTAAQLACTPVVVAISGQLSVVGILANLVAAPAVGPATVLGMCAGLAMPVWPALGRLIGVPAGWCVAWIAQAAAWGAALPGASLRMSVDAWSLTWVALVSVVLLVAGPRLTRNGRALAATVAVLVVVALLRGLSRQPPANWLVAVCDVGQGDTIVLNAGSGTAVVVDAGPDPELADACLDRFDVRVIPLVVLTHFHADHIDGLGGVLRGREVGEIDVTMLASPADGAAEVAATAAAVPVRTRVPVLGESRRIGAVQLQVLGPTTDPAVLSAGTETGEEGSAPNNASLVLLATVGRVRVLLTGDIEPVAQQRLAAAWPDLRVDVLKVPHHGSRFQDRAFLIGLGARVAIIPVGADNDYGHPSTELIGVLTEAGMRVQRTDRDGTVVITGSATDLGVTTLAH